MIDTIRENWSNKDRLQEILIDIVEEQLSIAAEISSVESSINQAFISEKEDSYKSTDSMARARAKVLVGRNTSELEYKFQAYTNLIGVITLRISQLQG